MIGGFNSLKGGLPLCTMMGAHTQKGKKKKNHRIVDSISAMGSYGTYRTELKWVLAMG